MSALKPRRNWWPAVAVGALVSGASAYLVYAWLGKSREEEEALLSLSVESRKPRRSHDATSQALGERHQADQNLQNHFHSIQRISDTTTLPQMLDELESGLDRVANVDQLIAQLQQVNELTLSGRSKMEMWQELKLVTWARTMSCTWLVAFADLLLRVQLNILGRHIFLQTHLLDPSQNGWSSQVPARRVTSRAQEMFVEYAHYLPEKASAGITARMRLAVAEEIGGIELSRPMNAETVLSHASSIHSAFEAWAVDQGWVRLMLPTEAEAAQYFSGYRGAPPDAGALGSEFLELDEEVLRGMVDELQRVMRSARFSAAVLAAVQQAAGAVARRLQDDMGGSAVPLAKLLPKITAAGNALLRVRDTEGSSWLRATAALPQVQELCASVYSCGPPP